MRASNGGSHAGGGETLGRILRDLAVSNERGLHFTYGLRLTVDGNKSLNYASGKVRSC